MNFFKLNKSAAPAPHSDGRTLGLLLAGTCALLLTVGALNGGTAVSTSVWDGFVTYLQGLLSSTFVIVLALIGLVALVWQIAHGRGYGHVGAVLGVLAMALLGPGLVSAAATATRDPNAVFAQVQTAQVQTVHLEPAAQRR